MASKKLKHKELYKNISLSLLILLSMVLFFRLWFGNWIWSYDMTSSDKTFFGLFDISSKSEPVNAEDIVMPKRLILTGGGKRIILEKGTSAFDSCYNSLVSLSAKIGSSALKPTAATEEEFVSALKSQSIFLDFGSAFGKQFLSLVGEDLPITATDRILITPGDVAIQRANIYVKDYVSGDIYKITSDLPSSSITSMIEPHVTAGTAGNIPFAFELGFDKVKGQEPSEISPSILLDSYITIGLADEPINTLDVSLPSIFTEITDNPSASDRIVSFFGFSPTSTRRYIEKDDVTTFVNKNATIKFSKNGILEYSAENGGISIAENGGNAGTSVLGNIYSLVQNIMIDCGVGEMQLHIASDLHSISNQNFSAVVNIDYLINGKSVTIFDDGKAVHPITITIQNGNIVSYKHYIYKFSPSDTTVTTSSMIKAVDLLYSQFENASVTVSDLYKSYVYTVGGDADILWCAQLKDQSDINIIRE